MRAAHHRTVLLTASVLAVPLVLTGPAQATGQGDSERSRPAECGSCADRGHARSGAGAGDGDRLVIGHRGASGYRPEHTLGSYELAARMGADFIEPDVVSTRDGVLVARHENEISGTTDVADRPEFADRRTTKVIDGTELTGWFTEDFTLAELKTLRAVERLPELREENAVYDGLYEVPTLSEVLELRAELSEELGREIGVYPETKHPTYFDGIGLSLEEPLVEDLEQAGLAGEEGLVFIQSFETANLRELDAVVDLPLVQLLSARGAPYDLTAAGDARTYADLSSAAGLAVIAGYADGVGPEKAQVIPRQADGSLGEPTSFVEDAHDAGLLVHPYTFRNENEFLPADLRDAGEEPGDHGRAVEEHLAFWAAGIDGMFTDNPDTGVLTRELSRDR